MPRRGDARSPRRPARRLHRLAALQRATATASDRAQREQEEAQREKERAQREKEREYGYYDQGQQALDPAAGTAPSRASTA